MVKRWLVFFVVVIFLTVGAAWGCAGPGEADTMGKTAEGTGGMVSAAHPIAVRAGLEILKKGGNAFDAAVAVAATLNVVEPMMSGVGGYGTILIYDAEKKQVRFLDSSGKIPVNTNPDAFRKPFPGYKKNRRGPKAVSTPGNVNAWHALSKTYGKLKWAGLFQRAAAVAREGYVVDERTARLIKHAFPEFPEHAKAFYGKSGRPLQKGETLVQKDLGDTLAFIAREGAAAFYGGRVGKKIDAEMKRTGGFLSLNDLTGDTAEWWEPISIDYRGLKVYTASPPSTAFPSLIRLGIMSRFDLKTWGHNSVKMLHTFSEVTKHAYGRRLKYAGDPGIKPPPLDKLLSEAYWKKQAAAIDPKRAKPFEYPGLSASKDSHTTHFVTADKWGNIVSATQTLGNSFGSRIMPEGTGIWLNNSLAYCTFEPPGNPMDAHPGHRKLSGDCPTIIMKDGKPWAALGTPGGHSIGQTVPQMVMNLIDFKMTIYDAIAAPRISFYEPETIDVEEGVGQAVIKALGKLGHKVYVIKKPGGLGNAHGLTIEYGPDGKPSRFTGAADPRGSGGAGSAAPIY